MDPQVTLPKVTLLNNKLMLPNKLFFRGLIFNRPAIAAALHKRLLRNLFKTSLQNLFGKDLIKVVRSSVELSIILVIVCSDKLYTLTRVS